MRIGVPQETTSGETRVALTPNEVEPLIGQRHEVIVEQGAGARAGHPDEEYLAQRARLGSRAEAFESDLVLRVHLSGETDDLGLVRAGSVLIGLADPLSHPAAVARIAEHGVVSFSLDLLPRITRAQAMDVLSSQSSVAGYRAALLGAGLVNRILPMMTTAAGTIPPARVLVLGAGVAGLQAIATARRLGAVVHAYDVRAAAREQVESVGGRFVDLPLDASAAEGSGGYAREQDEDFLARQREVLTAAVAASDVVIATAQIPGRPAPLLITKDMVEAMRPGSVIVDAAAAQGGNCELSQPEETVVSSGVTVIAPTNLPSGAAAHASRLYARNIANFARHLIDDDALRLDADDPIIQDTLLTRDGAVVNTRVRELLASMEER
jgi:NAD(P) transhydrogenase subunit alpha